MRPRLTAKYRERPGPATLRGRGAARPALVADPGDTVRTGLTGPTRAAPDVLSRPLRRRVEEIVSIGVTAAAAEPARFAGAPFAPRHCDNPNTARAALAGLVVAAEALVVEERS
jgi:hypothetical protein